MGFWRCKLRSSCLSDKQVTHWAMAPAPTFYCVNYIFSLVKMSLHNFWPFLCSEHFLELIAILLPQSSKCWHYKCEPLYSPRPFYKWNFRKKKKLLNVESCSTSQKSAFDWHKTHRCFLLIHSLFSFFEQVFCKANDLMLTQIYQHSMNFSSVFL